MKVILYFLMLMFSVSSMNLLATEINTTWKAGVAKIDITPVQPLLLAGYASRTSPATGKLTELWAKALFLEDANGLQAVLITSDLLGVPKQISDNIRSRIQKKYGLSKEQIMFNSSHTHTGPVLENALVDIYEVNDIQKSRISEYSALFENKIVDLVGMALKARIPAKIYSKNGATRFQVNRRNNVEAKLIEQTELKGPNDFAVPVLKVVDVKNDKLIAVSFGYACHPTVLS